LQELSGDYIGLDVGKKRIGVARINTEAKLPERLDPILTSSSEPFEAVLTVIKEYGAIGVVLGLPRGLEGQKTSQTQYSINFARELLSKAPNLPLFMIDEAGTSIKARDHIGKRTGLSVDSESAAIFLEDFINLKDIQKLRLKKL